MEAIGMVSQKMFAVLEVQREAAIAVPRHVSAGTHR
jgi:hypothetical protein